MAKRTIEQLLEAHPRLTRAGVLAAVRFGVEVLCADVYVAELTPGITDEFLSEKLQELVNAHARVAD